MSHHLRRMVMFDLVKLCGMHICYQCLDEIEDIADFSIEHKIPWLDSENPRELFFDLDNIAFSHVRCNTNAARRYKGPRPATKYHTRNTGSTPVAPRTNSIVV